MSPAHQVTIKLTRTPSSHQLAKFGGQRHCGSGDMILGYHVISQDHVIEGSCNFTILSSLVAIGTGSEGIMILH